MQSHIKVYSSITVDLQDLSPGIYFYSLNVDGNVVSEKKRIVLIK